MNGLLDTNVVLYLFGGRLAQPLPPGQYGISVITEMELFSWPGLSLEKEPQLHAFLAEVIIFDLTPPIRLRAVHLRRKERIKLPDAIICGTALELQVKLWTNDSRLASIPGLHCQPVPLIS